MTNDALLTPKETAQLLRKSEWLLWQWRREGIGPKWIETNPKATPSTTRPRYRRQDIEAWIEGQTRGGDAAKSEGK